MWRRGSPLAGCSYSRPSCLFSFFFRMAKIKHWGITFRHSHQVKNWSTIDLVSTGWLITLRLWLVGRDWFNNWTDIQASEQPEFYLLIAIILFIDYILILLFYLSHSISLCICPFCSLCVPLLSHRFMDQWSVGEGGKVTFLGPTNLRACWIERCLE